MLGCGCWPSARVDAIACRHRVADRVGSHEEGVPIVRAVRTLFQLGLLARLEALGSLKDALMLVRGRKAAKNQRCARERLREAR